MKEGFHMSENQNEVVKEEKKKSSTGPQKNLRFSSDTEKDQLVSILSTLSQEGIAVGETDGDRVLSALKSILSEGQKAEIIANANPTLATVFESSFIELNLMQERIIEKYQALMTVANLEVDKVRAELTDHFQKKVEKLEKANERLESELSSLNSKKEDLQSLLDAKEHLVTEATTRVEDLNKTLETKDLSIAALQSQLDSKDQLVEEFKSRIDDSNATIAQMTITQQESLSKMETLRSENDELKLRYQENIKDISKLSSDLEKANIELNHAKKNAERYDNELIKLESRYQSELEQLRKELANERQSKSDLQSELMKLMTALTTQTKETKAQKTESSQQQRINKPFVIKNETGTQVWSGNKNGLIKYVNNKQSEVKVTTSTSVDEIEKLLYPCVLEY